MTAMLSILAFPRAANAYQPPRLDVI
jgi:hypothetical protein